MRYFGIEKPATERDPSFIFWIGTTASESWSLFLNDHKHRSSMSEAIRAYQSIGYKCVELEIKVKEKNDGI